MKHISGADIMYDSRGTPLRRERRLRVGFSVSVDRLEESRRAALRADPGNGQPRTKRERAHGLIRGEW